jgi:uncharacterized membrane protein (UPF0127 family)
MLQKIQVTLIILLIPLGGLYMYSESTGVPIRELFSPTNTIMHIDEIPIRISIAETKEERERGLSGKKGLKETEAMLFIFPESDYHGIWMKGMRFPIDIIWISEDREVIAVDSAVSPGSYPKIYEPPRPAKYVVEANARFAQTFGIGVGDAVVLPLKYRGVETVQP